MKPALPRHAHLRPKVLLGTAAAAGAATLGSLAWQHRQRALNNAGAPSNAKFLIPPAVVDALAGALGEMAQISVLYPLDTIKVRCQAMGMTSKDVVQELLSTGVNLGLLKKLYAGVFGAAACAIVVGAVHLASYETSRRFFLQKAADAVAVSEAKTASSTVSSSSSSKGTVQTSSAAAAAAASSSSCSGSQDDAPLLGLNSEDQDPPGTSTLPDHARLTANVLAAVFSAFVTAMVESPVELFRHNQQAGLVKGSFLSEMVHVVRNEGPAGLYWGFLPHCFEAWPHDVSELLVVGALNDFHADAAHPLAAHHGWMRRVPLPAWDMAIGAASGAAAVLVSMPFDCVKTYMQTHGTDLTGRGVLGSAGLFLLTGQKIIKRKGVGSLYYGVAPRLLQQVPSAMLCWWTMRAVQRTLLPYTALGQAQAAAAAAKEAKY